METILVFGLAGLLVGCIFGALLSLILEWFVPTFYCHACYDSNKENKPLSRLEYKLYGGHRKCK